jgi:hypothetical protein
MRALTFEYAMAEGAVTTVYPTGFSVRWAVATTP